MTDPIGEGGGFFHFHSREKSAIYILLLISIILLFAQIGIRYWYIPSLPQNLNPDSVLVYEEVLKKPIPKNEFIPPLRPFDPNTATLAFWIDIGLDSLIAHRIIKYLRKGGRFTSVKDLEKIYGIKLDYLAGLDPYLIFPKPKSETKHKHEVNSKRIYEVRPVTSSKVEALDLNHADSAQLVRLKGIGPKRAQGILKYRSLLGGYHDLGQLNEVYGLDTPLVSEISEFLFVEDSEEKINRLRINLDSFKILLKHPYMGYEQLKITFNYKKQHGDIKSIKDLENTRAFSAEELNKILPYLDFSSE